MKRSGNSVRVCLAQIYRRKQIAIRDFEYQNINEFKTLTFHFCINLYQYLVAKRYSSTSPSCLLLMVKMGEMKMDEIFLLVIATRDNWMRRSDDQFNLF